jgi:hypothetical protein
MKTDNDEIGSIADRRPRRWILVMAIGARVAWRVRTWGLNAPVTIITSVLRCGRSHRTVGGMPHASDRQDGLTDSLPNPPRESAAIICIR